VWHQLKPRDQRTAARTAALTCLVTAIVIAVSNLIVSFRSGASIVTLEASAAVLIVLAALLIWPRFRFVSQLLVLTPLLAVGIVCFLNISTRDNSAGAQVAFCLPVLFAASQLRALGAWTTALSAVVANTAAIWHLPASDGKGTIDAINVALVLCLMTGLLVMAGRRQNRLIARLESLASLDPLTGLVTRRVLDEAMQQTLNAPEMPEQAEGCALVLVDVDNFKAINDGYGHPVGDDALVHISRLLTQRARPGTVISRIGGDEIAVLLPGCTRAVACQRAHDFLTAVQETPLILRGGFRLKISISAGVAHARIGECRLRELYAAADASLYEAKRGGRGRVGSADALQLSSPAAIFLPAGEPVPASVPAPGPATVPAPVPVR